MVKKLSVLKPFSFSYYSSEDTISNFEKDMLRKESMAYKQNFKQSFFSDFCFACSTCANTCFAIIHSSFPLNFRSATLV